MKVLLEALMNFKSEVEPMVENSSGYGYKYAGLEQIVKNITPILKKHKLIYTQVIEEDSMITTLHHLDSDATLTEKLMLPIDDLVYVEVEKVDKKGNPYKQWVILGFEGMNKAQAYGSLITYFRRYSISVMLDLITETDTDGTDGKGADKKSSPKQKTGSKELSENRPDGKPKQWLNDNKKLPLVVAESIAKGMNLKDLYTYYKISGKVKVVLEKEFDKQLNLPE